MSVVQPRSEPTLGTVRPKSRLAKLLDVRARLRHQVELAAAQKAGPVPSRVAEWAWMVLWRTMSVRRCMTRIGVSW